LSLTQLNYKAGIGIFFPISASFNYLFVKNKDQKILAEIKKIQTLKNGKKCSLFR
jgi:hypothetical protein